MKLRKETTRIQERFGSYCRTGVATTIPGTTPGRIHHYRRLVNNVVRDTLDTAYPITLAALGEETWDDLVQDFFSRGNPSTPQIWKLPFEFYKYHVGMESGRQLGRHYLDDLLYFEWIEIEVYNMPDRPSPSYTADGDILQDRLAINPEHEIIRLGYPVHMYAADKASDMKGDYYAMVFRDPDTGHVHFLDMSPMNIYILTRLMEEDVPLNELKGGIARFTGIESITYLDEALSTFIGQLMKKKLILGYKSD